MFTCEFTNPDDISLLPELLRKRFSFPKSLEDDETEGIFFENSVPMNVYFDKEGNEYFELGLAGVPEESIEVLKKGGTITVSLKNLEASPEVEYEVHQLLNENGEVANIEIDEDCFNSEPTVAYKNGLLVLKFNLKEEEKPKQIKIMKVN